MTSREEQLKKRYPHLVRHYRFGAELWKKLQDPKLSAKAGNDYFRKKFGYGRNNMPEAENFWFWVGYEEGIEMDNNTELKDEYGNSIISRSTAICRNCKFYTTLFCKEYEIERQPDDDICDAGWALNGWITEAD